MPGGNWICYVISLTLSVSMLEKCYNKCQLQRVNRIGKLTVGMLTQKDGRDCPSCWAGADWLAMVLEI